MQKGQPKNTGRNMLLSGIFWVALWQFGSMLVGEPVLLPSPLNVFFSLLHLLPTKTFWGAVLTSFGRISLGFILGLLCGILLAWAAKVSNVIQILLRPMLLLVHATPIASFVILALVWVSNRRLSTLIAFLMVLPVIYTVTLNSLALADPQLLEMASVFKIPFWRRVRAIYLPAITPPLLSACEVALGLCWKSGVAAELIGLAQGTIGEQLFQAKIYVMTPEMFAWTAVIILLSWGVTKLVLAVLGALARRLERGSTSA